MPYELIFKERMSPEALKLLTDTSHVGVGGLIAAVLTFAFYFLGARILGPVNFGNFSLVMSISAMLGLSMAIGVTPMIKYASEIRDDAVRAEIISTAYIQVALLVAASGAIYLLLSGRLSQLFGVSEAVFLFAVAYAVAGTLLMLTQNSLRIFFRMKTFALVNASQSAIVVTIFLAFVGINLRGWQSAAYATVIADAALSVVLVVHLRRYVKLQYARLWGARILKYGSFSLPGAVAGGLMAVDRILINIFKTTADVGIYQAYLLVSISIAAMIWTIFNAGFFPYASRSSNKFSLAVKINQAVPYFSLLVPPIFIVEVIAFVFYGRQYPFSAQLALTFAVAATIYILYLCYSWLIASEGVAGAKINTVSSIIALMVLLGLDVVLIPPIGILGAAIALVFAYLAPTLYLFSRRDILSGR